MSKNRTIRIYHNDLSQDAKACADMINTACSRRQSWRVTGLLSGDDFLLVTLEECASNRLKYNFVPLESVSADDLGAEISSRYFAGFTLVGGFRLRDNYWALLSSELK